MKRRQTAGLALLALLVSLSSAARASDGAEKPAGADEQSSFCTRPFAIKSLLRSKSSTGLYNGGLWLGGAAAIEFGTTPATRWTHKSSFDTGIRSGLRAGSTSERKRSDTASDVMLGLAAGVMPLVAIGRTIARRDCEEAFAMATDAFESISLTVFLTQATKAISGRERPYVEQCDGSPPGDASCRSSDRKASFFSGHASIAAAGAGLSCAYAIKRKTWGESRLAQAVPCVLGSGAAVTAGILRIVADKHWGSDVIVGLMVGMTVGYFDTWGPFDLLRFETHSNKLALDVRGIVLPYASNGQIGMRVGLSF